MCVQDQSTAVRRTLHDAGECSCSQNVCTGSKYCCEENSTQCCSSLSVGVIVAMAVGGAVFVIAVILLVLFIVLKQKKSARVQTSHDDLADTAPPSYTPSVFHTNTCTSPPPQYILEASGSSPPPPEAQTEHASETVKRTDYH